MLRISAILLVLIAGQCVAAETFNDVSKTKTISEQIMNHFVKEEFVKGLDIAKKYWPLPPVEIDGLANQINTQWSVVKQRFGNPTGYEFVREERLGNAFVRLYYLHKFENHAIYWRFTYYKPGDGWKINGITFEDGFDFLFETVD